MGSDLEVGHAGACFLDDTYSFVSQYSPRGYGRNISF